MTQANQVNGLDPVGSELAAELEDLRTRLAEAEAIVHAIREGEVDAVVVNGKRGEQVYTLCGNDRIYRQLIETMSEAAVTLSADGIILYCNISMARLLDRPLDHILGSTLRNSVPLADQQPFDDVLLQARSTSGRVEIGVRTAAGCVVPIQLSASHMRNEDMEIVFCLVLTDLSEQKRHQEIVAEERLARSILENAGEADRHLAAHDALTGLINRMSLRHMIERNIANAAIHHTSFAVLFIDLDNFKHFNDTFGHATGDAVLKIVAARIVRQVRTQDSVGRLGGDEFVVIIPGALDAYAFKAAARILRAIQTPFHIEPETELRVAASIGVSRYPTDGTTTDELLARSDTAMYRVKVKGGNALDFFRGLPNASGPEATDSRQALAESRPGSQAKAPAGQK